MAAVLAAGVTLSATGALPGGSGQQAGGRFAPPDSVHAVLDNAAIAAGSLPQAVPSPSQFAYIKLISPGRGRAGADHQPLIEEWIPAGGQGPGLITEAGHSEQIPAGSHTSFTDWPYARLSQVPASPSALLAYVRHAAATAEDQETPQQADFRLLWELIAQPGVPAKLESAAYRALTMIPGVRLQAGATDAAGRHGIAVTLAGAGRQIGLILNPRTYRYLGFSDVLLRPSGGLPAGTEVSAEAVLATGIVNSAGQRP